MSMDVKGKRVLVCGMARSGIAAAKLLLSKGALVTISDTKAENCAYRHAPLRWVSRRTD